MIQPEPDSNPSDLFSTYYVACSVQDNCDIRCWDQHKTIHEAVGCIQGASGFIRAVTNGRDRPLAYKEYELLVRLLLELYWEERKISREDFLTDVLNRRGFMEVLEYEGKRSRRFGSPMTTVSVDLDGFKFVNDTIGYGVGDSVLRVVAQTLKKTLREMDSVARLGGDEFGVLLPETNSRNTRVVIEKCRKALLEKMADYNWGVTFSIGAVTFRIARTAAEMLELANKVMSNAKRSGKDRISYLTLD